MTLAERTPSANLSAADDLAARVESERSPQTLQPLQLLLQRLEPLAGIPEPAFGRQPLIVGEIARGFGDERVDVWLAGAPGGDADGAGRAGALLDVGGGAG